MPRQNVPVVNEDGTMNVVWYRFFLSLWNVTGLWRLPVRRIENSDGSADANPLLLYNSNSSAGYPNGYLRVIDPEFPNSGLHGGFIKILPP